MPNTNNPNRCKCQSTQNKDKIVRITEQTSFLGGCLGVIFAGLYEPLLYTLLPFPLYFALINNNNRHRFEQEQQVRLLLANTIANIQQKIQCSEQKIEHLFTDTSELKQSQKEVVDDVRQSIIFLEQRIKDVELSITQLEVNSQQLLTRTHLSPIIAKLQQIQHQQKYMELGQIANILRLIEGLEKQIDELSTSTLTLQKENQKYQKQLENLQQGSFGSYRHPRKKIPHRGQHDRIAIFIDGANLYHMADKLNMKIAYSQLLSVIKANSRVYRAYFYTGVDSTNEKEKLFLSRMHRSGFYIISKEVIKRADGSTKANLDGEIISDMLMLSLANSYDSAILVSGDGDFLDVVQRVQSLGKRVEVVSFRKNTNKALIDVADSYLDLMEIKELICQNNQLQACS